MKVSEQFPFPTKIRFVSPEGTDVAAVFADRITGYKEGYSFYFGRLCAAILCHGDLMLGGRRVRRSALRAEKPFSYDSPERKDQLPDQHSRWVVLRRAG